MSHQGEPLDPAVAQRVHASFERHGLMQTIGATLTLVAPGLVEIELPFRGDLTQQHGFLHAGIVAALADVACGYAAFTLMPANSEVLTVEFKVNFLAPASGEQFRARGEVIRAGRTLTACRGSVFSLNEGKEDLIATMLASMIRRERGEGG